MPDGVAVFLGPTDWRAGDAWGGLVEAARIAVASGLPVLLGEHARRPDYVPSALVAAALLSVACPGIDVTTAGVVAGARDPVSVERDAAVAAAAAAAAGSRFSLGLVAGYDAADLPGERLARRFRVLDDLVAGLSAARPCPVLVGGSVERAIERAARVDGWIAPTQVDATEVARLAAVLRSRSAGARVVVVRRWLPVDDPRRLGEAPQPAGSRTPPERLLGGGPGAVAEAVGALQAAGSDLVALGPVASPMQLDRLLSDLGGL